MSMDICMEGNEGPMRRAQKAIAVCEGRVETSDDGMVWWEDELHLCGGRTMRPYVSMSSSMSALVCLFMPATVHTCFCVYSCVLIMCMLCEHQLLYLTILLIFAYTRKPCLYEGDASTNANHSVTERLHW